MKFHKFVCAQATLLGLALGVQEETINGYKFIHSGPKKEATKAVYEKEATDNFVELIKARLGPDGIAKALSPETDPDNARCLYLKDGGPGSSGGADPDGTDRFCLAHIKHQVGEAGLVQALSQDIAKAATFWADINARSTNTSHVSAHASTYIFLPGLNAALFALWMQSTLSDIYYIDGNAGHFYKHTTLTGLTSTSVQIFEGWGGEAPPTKFVVPDYTVIQQGKSDKYPYLAPRSEFPIQAVGGKTLDSGLVFGALHIYVRDVKGSDFGSDINGIEVGSDVWYGDAMPDDELEYERQHMVIEMINFSMKAQQDITLGLLKPPTV